ncbi:APC family permease, partial [Luteibacter sp.]|uniref:APC family permease n=1 Tax=Luteibacter sp. TaxID=1886636 RepID=UPI003F809164
TIHPKYRTPHLNTVITGVGIAALAAVFPLNLLGDLTSMGTLVAFCAVCIGVLILRHTSPDTPRTFRVPFAWVTCTLGVLSCIGLLYSLGLRNWVLLGVWTALGVIVYFAYSFRHSKNRRAG